MPDNITEINGLPVNAEGEVLARLGTGGRTVAGVLPRDYTPVNAQGEMAVNLVPAATDESFVTAKRDAVTGGVTLQAGSVLGIAGESYLSKTCTDVVNGAGVLNGQATDTGQLWVVSGAGYLTTIINGDHIEGTQNTYCHVNTGSKIAKAIQYYSGAMATVEIGLDSNLTDMIHANFTSSSGTSVSYWKTGVGSAQAAKFSVQVANCPNLNDGVPHKLELHVSGAFAFTYADGILTSITYEPNFPSITGNWFFAQIHGAGEKIYGVEAYSGTAILDAYKPDIEAELVSAVSAAVNTLVVGNPSGAGFSPISSSYFWTDDADGHVFGGAGQAVLKAKSATNGYSAKVCAVAAIGTETGVVSGNDGVGSVQHQGNDRIKFPFNTSRVDFPYPLTLPVYTVATLPSAATPYQRAFVSDASTPAFGATVAGGGAVKAPVYSDGTNWKVG